MAIEWDVALKAGAVLAGLIGATKVIYELIVGSHGRRRDEYKFARDFFRDLKDEAGMHPFLKEKGCQAVAGDAHVSAAEIEYVLSLERPDRALRDFVLGRPYLQFSKVDGFGRLGFRPEYEKSWSRLWRKIYFTICYGCLFFLAISPFVLSSWLGRGVLETVWDLGVLFVLCGPLTWMALVSLTRVCRAEKLVRDQSAHTQTLLVCKKGAAPVGRC
ncbi:hypothetical protein LMG3441_01375 [Achromobacter kerstersii]|uniref:Uncharacterized protein n=2 Tax=Achromobacter kerstersii TaxID=1353890 RepID=A0A6S6ZFZ6_9BURK|nr:hypothetical protein LMG3441_01375 [Achromobacter kerstersii]